MTKRDGFIHVRSDLVNVVDKGDRPYEKRVYSRTEGGSGPNPEIR